MKSKDMNKLIKAAKHALEELANARDHIWLSQEKAQPLTDEEILKKIQAALCDLHYTMKKIGKRESRQKKQQVAKNATTKWVGLTDEDLSSCKSDEFVVFARAIEAKLKEKNS